MVQGWTGRSLILQNKIQILVAFRKLGPSFVLLSSQILQVDDHVSITASGHIVQVEHALVSDTGRYTCIATNIVGEDEKDFDVNVQGELG